MTLSASSIAAAVGASVKNVQFQSTAETLPRKVLVIGTYDPLKTLVVPNVVDLCTGPGDAAGKYGRGSMLHRLVNAVYKGSGGVEMYVVPQEEVDDPVQAAGSISFAGSMITAAGTLYLYISSDQVAVPLAVADDPAAIAAKVVAKITANADLSVTSVVDGNAADITAKMAGPYGNSIKLSFNEGFQEKYPEGLTAVVTDMTGGTGIPDIQNALDALGTGDNVNNIGVTDVVHGYGLDSTTLDALSTWNGAGNEALGCYDKLVARPVRCLHGDIVSGSGGLSALQALGDGRVLDRTNGVVAVPGSCSHPAEIAAVALGIMARLNNNRASESYVGKLLPGVYPGANANNWCNDYDNRNTAVEAGVSPTLVVGRTVVLQNVVTFYHPDSITKSSNGYRSMRNVSIIQNLLAAVQDNFRGEKWQGISIVSDTAKVTNVIDRQKARDLDAVMDDLIALATAFETHAWTFSAAFTIDRLKAGGYISVRAGGLGFDIVLPVMLSGEGGIIDTEVQFDTNISILL
jgi:phage tail sheath gpL-like